MADADANAVAGAPADGSDGPVLVLQAELKLAADKLQNCEDELEALYKKSLKNDAKEQERVARHHKAVNQLQKKVLAEAEIKRQLQRKLDDKTEPLREKEAVWAAEHDTLSAQVNLLEDQKRGMLAEMANSSEQLRRYETSLLDMNAGMQDLEKNGAQWKIAAEKRKAQVADAVAAQRSSDSRVVVLEAELKRRRDEVKSLQEKVSVPTPGADVQTQTECIVTASPKEIRRQELEQWAQLMQELVQACSEAALAVESTVKNTQKLTQIGSTPPLRAVPSADANVGTEQQSVCHVAIETEAVPLAQCFDAFCQTEQVLHAARADVRVQTVAVTRYHIDSQTDPVSRNKGINVDIQTNYEAPATRAHSDAATATSPQSFSTSLTPDAEDKQIEEGSAKTRHTSEAPLAAIIKSDGESRDERWWRRSPLKAADVSLPDSPNTPLLMQGEARAVHLKMHVSTLDNIIVGGDDGWANGGMWPVSPNAMGSGTPHPQPGFRRHFAGTPPSMRTMVPAPSRYQDVSAELLQWPPGKQRALVGASAVTPGLGVPDAALKRPLFRASEGPLQVRLPASPGPSPVIHEVKHSTIGVLQSQIAAEEAVSPNHMRHASVVINVANISMSTKNESSTHLLGEKNESPKTAGDVKDAASSAALSQQPHHALVGTNRVEENTATERRVQVSAVHTSGGDEAEAQGMKSLKNVSDGVYVTEEAQRLGERGNVLGRDTSEIKFEIEINSESEGVGVKKDQARAQNSIVALHNVESALLAGCTGKISIPPHVLEHACMPVSKHANETHGGSVPLASSMETCASALTPKSAELVETVVPQAAGGMPGMGNDVEAHDVEAHAHDEPTGSRSLSMLRTPSPQGTHHPGTHHPIRLITEEGPHTITLSSGNEVGGAKSLCRVSSSPACSGAGTPDSGRDEDYLEQEVGHDLGANGKSGLVTKWVFGSPRDAVSLLDQSPHTSLRMRAATVATNFNTQPQPDVIAGSRADIAAASSVSGAPDGTTPDSDSSDDETWNGFVARGVRPRLHRSLLDEAAGLSKTLSNALANNASSSRSSNVSAASRTAQAASQSDARGSEQQAEMLQRRLHRRLQRPRLTASGASTARSNDSVDLHTDLNGLLEEVRRATDRCERRKRMVQLLDKNSAPVRNNLDSPHTEEHNTLHTHQEGSLTHKQRGSTWTRTSIRGVQENRDWRHDGHSEGRAHNRRKGLLNHRFGGESRPMWAKSVLSSSALSSSTGVELPSDSCSGEYATRPPERGLLLSGSPGSRASLYRSPISPERDEVLKMMIGAGDSSVQWSPIKPAQMAVLRSFLTKLDPDPPS